MATRAARLWSRLPGTVVLSVVTFAVFLVQIVLGGMFDLPTQVRLGALQPQRVAESHELFRLFMPALIHDGILHLGLVELALVQLASLAETVWGTRRMLVVWFWGAIAGSTASAMFSDSTNPASVGGSAAAMALAGLLLGTSWFGPEHARAFLFEVVGMRLIRAVTVTFVIGLGSLAFPVVDNWAHLGGLLFGVAASLTFPEEGAEARPSPIVGWATAVTALLVVAWTAVSGDDALATLDLEAARLDAARISDDPDGLTNGELVVDMLDHFEKAGALDEGLEVVTRAVGRATTPLPVARTAALLVLEAEKGRPWDPHADVAIARWLALDPTDTDALNLAAWHLVTRSDTDHRDAVRAETLARDALARLPSVEERRRSEARAAYLDTLAEALYQQGRMAEAEEVQKEAVGLATEAELETLPDMNDRLLRIESALRGAG